MFDQTKADKAVKFIKLLKHTKGRWAGVPFQLLPWQQRIVEDLFGTLTKDGLRQYRIAYIEVPRKQGKSELAGAIANALLFMDKEAGAEIYSAANDREQASLVFNVAAEMVKQSPALRKRSRIISSQKRIILPNTNSFYRAISADAYSKHGFNAHAVIYDELHAAPNRDLYDVLLTSMGAREQPLMLVITTAGTDRLSICYELHEYASKILSGSIQDSTFYAYIAAADTEDDWLDEAVWAKANPSLGHTVSIDFLRQEAERAKHSPAYQNTFRRLFLNQWTQQTDRWLDLYLWDENASGAHGMVIEEQLKGRTCYGGLDLSAVKDLTAFVLVFPYDDDPDECDVLCRFWCPESRLTDPTNRYRDQYQVWKREGFLTATPGDAIDYQFIKAQIIKDAQQFNLVDMNVDRLFQGYQLMMELQEENILALPFNMNWQGITKPMLEMERRALARKLHHGGNPVLRWMMDSMAVRYDYNNNPRPDKASSQGKIDGVVALIMALDRAMRRQEPFYAGSFVV